MQHTLLGIGLLLIAAIVAALAAPLFVDWNAWRAEFERRASLLVNAPVTIKGPIEATILPLPAFALHDVTIGAPQGTRISAAHIRGVLSLGALLRGRLEAEEIALAKPELRLSYGADGTIDLPVPVSPERAQNFSISRVAFDGGTIFVQSPAGKMTRYDQASGVGTLQSRNGPFKLEIAGKRDGQGFAARLNTTEFRDGAGRVRLVIAPAEGGLALEAEGNLAIADARPRFDGKATLSRRSEAMPWKVSAQAQADLKSVLLDQLAVSFGKEENAVELSGNGRIEPQAGKFDASLAAKNADLDRLGEDAKTDVISALAPLRAALAEFSSIPLSGRVTLAIDNLLAAGAVARDLKGELTLRDGLLLPQRLEARLPGLAVANFAARGNQSDAIAGTLRLAAEEPAALAHWLGLDRAGFAFEQAGSLRLDAELRAARQRLSFEPFTLAYGDAKLSGSAAYVANEDKPARIEAKLNADKPDLALLPASLRSAELAGLDVSLTLDARAPKLLNGNARRLDAALSLNGGALLIERLSLEDFGGLNLRARGELGSWREHASGRIEFETEAARADGLVTLARALPGSGEVAPLIGRITAASVPLQMKGAIVGNGTGSEVALEASGRAGDMDAKLTLRIDPRTPAIAEARIVAEAKDAARLVPLVGLPAPEPYAGQGRLEAAIGRAKEGAFPLKANLAFPGVSISADGTLRSAEGHLYPQLELRLQATDARALSLAVARAAGTVVPATGSARLSRKDDALVLDDIALGLGANWLRGRLVVNGFDKPNFSGAFSADRAELPALLALVTGRAGESAGLWSDKPLGLASLENASGTVDIEANALGLIGPYVANGAKLKLGFSGNGATIEGFSAELAGGKLAGKAQITRANPLVVNASVSLAGGDVARLVAPAAARAIARGYANITLQASAQGNSPAAIIGNAIGQGSLAIEGLEIDKLDPEAMLKLIPAANTAPSNETEAAKLLAFGLQRAPLRIAKLEAPLALNAGVVRAGRTRTPLGPVAVTMEASLDLAKSNLDAALGLAPESEKNAARGEAVVRWRGPAADPKRSIDVSAFLVALSLQAADAEMQKLEGRPASLSIPAAPPAASISMPLPRQRPAEVPPPAAAELPPLPPPVQVRPAPAARPRPNPWPWFQ